jgi:hypothetical protein
MIYVYTLHIDNFVLHFQFQLIKNKSTLAFRHRNALVIYQFKCHFKSIIDHAFNSVIPIALLINVRAF